MINKFIRRAFCMHLAWRKGRSLGQAPHHNDYVYVLGKGQLIPWTCCRCGKVKHFTDREPPIQYLGR